MRNEGIRETLKKKEQEWREQGYPVDKARELAEAYRHYCDSCYGPDEYGVPDEYGRCMQVLMRDTDFGLMERYFALAQEMVLRYLSKEFRTVLRWAHRWAVEGFRYDYWYTGRSRYGTPDEVVDQINREYKDCLERERQERKRLQENSTVSQGFRRGCVEVLALLDQAARAERERIPKKLLELLDRNSDPYYEFKPEKGKELKDMELLPETKGLLAMLYRNYWCKEEERKEYDKILRENDTKCGRDPVVQESCTDEEIELLTGLFEE